MLTHLALCLGYKKINLCILSSPTQGLNFSIFGKNFGNKVNHVEIYLGQMVLKVLSLTYNIKFGLCIEVRAEIPPMVFHFSRAVRLEVNGQSSDRNHGNQVSSTFFVETSSIRYVDLGENTPNSWGYFQIFIYGANFGRHKEDVVVTIGGQVANIMSVTDEKYVTFDV